MTEATGSAEAGDQVPATDDVSELIDLWDQQQAAYITHRERRFDIMLEVLEDRLADDDRFTSTGEGAVVLDLACGPGSLSARIAKRFPEIRVIAVDYDPVLLAIAAAGPGCGGRISTVDLDLAARDWTDALPVDTVDFAVSSTALHWLAPHDLAAMYAALATVIRPGGLFLNADHLRYNRDTQPLLHDLAARDDEHTQSAAREGGALTWEQWWSLAAQHPIGAPLVAERERRFADRPPTPHASVNFHRQALEVAGFAETGTVWQHYDDYVLLARR